MSVIDGATGSIPTQIHGSIDPILSRLLELGLVAEPGEAARLHEQSVRDRTSFQHELVTARGTDLDAVYAAFSVYWGAPVINPDREPLDAELLRAIPVSEHIARGWIPWRFDDADTLTIATTRDPDDGLLRAVRAAYGVETIRARTITPTALDEVIGEACRAELLYTITDLHADEHPHESARAGLAWWQKALPFVVIVGVIASGIVWPGQTVIAVFFTANFIFYGFVMFKAYLGMRVPLSMLRQRSWQSALGVERRSIGKPGKRRTADRDLPIYTILVPAYKEASIIGKLVENLGRLDYPQSKLQVLLLLEEDDQETIEAALATNPPSYVTILVTPDGQPRTKPRACNYGLQFARGEYVVIFDAEDRPDPGQLRDAVAAFELNTFIRERIDPATPELACVQAALAYFNADYDALTRMFAIEYSHWFDAMLPGMDGTGIPIPLGGTSNHFRTSTLREIGGWDAYNVTEDADLGLRISNRGFAVGTIDSTTAEEACAVVAPWIRQRTRWIKGYMLTAAVNLQHPISFLRRNGIGGAMSMGLLVAGTPLSFMLYPLSILFTVVTWLGVEFGGFRFPDWVLQASLLVMVFGMTMLILSSALVAWRRYGWRIAVFAPLLPAYWLLHSIAAWRAAHQAIFDPHRWEKTPHGLTEDYETEGVAS
jgi:cellulose synthase/poly-beta-1,6-N-acetylglucosamine synthase-like glycosyltransferase